MNKVLERPAKVQGIFGNTRQVKVTVNNHSKNGLTVSKKQLAHGKWLVEPHKIEANQTGHFEAEKTTGAPIGVQGLVQYDTGHASFTIRFQKPLGTDESYIEVNDSGAGAKLRDEERSKEIISAIVDVQ